MKVIWKLKHNTTKANGSATRYKPQQQQQQQHWSFILEQRFYIGEDWGYGLVTQHASISQWFDIALTRTRSAKRIWGVGWCSWALGETYLNNIIQVLNIGNLGIDKFLCGFGALVIRIAKFKHFVHGEARNSNNEQ
jgi:hypothetical protein